MAHAMQEEQGQKRGVVLDQVQGFPQQSKHIGASEAVNKSEQQAARLDQHADTCTVPHLPHILFHDAVGSTSFSAGETSSQATRAHCCLHLIDERLYNEKCAVTSAAERPVSTV